MSSLRKKALKELLFFIHVHQIDLQSHNYVENDKILMCELNNWLLSEN